MTDNERQVGPGNLDVLLTQRTQQGSEMPWLELKVMNQVEWRERARQWLRTHPGGLSSPPQPLRLRLWQAICGMSAARTWHIVGMLLICVVLGYVATLLLPAAAIASPESRPLSTWTLVTVGAGLATIATALVNWPRLRQFYS